LSPGYGGKKVSTRSVGIKSASRSRSNSVLQLPPKSQAIMMAQARLSTGSQSSGFTPRISISGGRAIELDSRISFSTALMPAV
jgi:hypothetical protein